MHYPEMTIEQIPCFIVCTWKVILKVNSARLFTIYTECLSSISWGRLCTNRLTPNRTKFKS